MSDSEGKRRVVEGVARGGAATPGRRDGPAEEERKGSPRSAAEVDVDYMYASSPDLVRTCSAPTTGKNTLSAEALRRALREDGVPEALLESLRVDVSGSGAARFRRINARGSVPLPERGPVRVLLEDGQHNARSQEIDRVLSELRQVIAAVCEPRAPGQLVLAAGDAEEKSLAASGPRAVAAAPSSTLPQQPLHVAILVASPIFGQSDAVYTPETDFEEQLVDVMRLFKNHSGLCVEVNVATRETLRETLLRKPRVLQLHCHGRRRLHGNTELAFENANGQLDLVSEKDLRFVLSGIDMSATRVVFINSCNSANFARVFIGHGADRSRGVRCAIGVNPFTRVLNVACIAFSKHFYEALLTMRMSARASFDRARRAVTQGRTSCSAHEHSPDCKLRSRPREAELRPPHGCCDGRENHDPKCEWAKKFLTESSEFRKIVNWFDGSCVVCEKREDLRIAQLVEDVQRELSCAQFDFIESSRVFVLRVGRPYVAQLTAPDHGLSLNVRFEPLRVCCCSPHLPHDERSKFQFIADGIEDCTVFEPSELEHKANHVAAAAAAAAAEPELRVIPQQRARMVGRNRDLADIIRMLTSDSDDHAKPNRLINVYGPEGIGKTHFLTVVAGYIYDRRRQHFRRGVIFLDLSHSRTFEDVIRQLAQRLSMSYLPEQQLIVERMKNWSLLLLFANCDAFVDESDSVRSFEFRNWLTLVLHACRYVAVVVGTTRRLPWQTPDSDRVALGPLDENAAVELFLLHARKIADELRDQGILRSFVVPSLSRPSRLTMLAQSVEEQRKELVRLGLPSSKRLDAPPQKSPRDGAAGAAATATLTARPGKVPLQKNAAETSGSQSAPETPQALASAASAARAEDAQIVSALSQLDVTSRDVLFVVALFPPGLLEEDVQVLLDQRLEPSELEVLLGGARAGASDDSENLNWLTVRSVFDGDLAPGEEKLTVLSRQSSATPPVEPRSDGSAFSSAAPTPRGKRQRRASMSQAATSSHPTTTSAAALHASDFLDGMFHIGPQSAGSPAVAATAAAAAAPVAPASATTRRGDSRLLVARKELWHWAANAADDRSVALRERVLQQVPALFVRRLDAITLARRPAKAHSAAAQAAAAVPSSTTSSVAAGAFLGTLSAVHAEHLFFALRPTLLHALTLCAGRASLAPASNAGAVAVEADGAEFDVVEPFLGPFERLAVRLGEAMLARRAERAKASRDTMATEVCDAALVALETATAKLHHREALFGNVLARATLYLVRARVLQEARRELARLIAHPTAKVNAESVRGLSQEALAVTYKGLEMTTNARLLIVNQSTQLATAVIAARLHLVAGDEMNALGKGDLGRKCLDSGLNELFKVNQVPLLQLERCHIFLALVRSLIEDGEPHRACNECEVLLEDVRAMRSTGWREDVVRNVYFDALRLRAETLERVGKLKEALDFAAELVSQVPPRTQRSQNALRLQRDLLTRITAERAARTAAALAAPARPLTLAEAPQPLSALLPPPPPPSLQSAEEKMAMPALHARAASEVRAPLVSMLHSDPLVQDKDDGLLPLILHHSRNEWAAIRRAIRGSPSPLRFRRAVATRRSLREDLQHGVAVLHLSCHGHPTLVDLESEERPGVLDALSAEDLEKMLKAQPTQPALVFLNFSRASEGDADNLVAHALLRAGVGIAVCVSTRGQPPSDAKGGSANEFVGAFYAALFGGVTVKEAFDSAMQKGDDLPYQLISLAETAASTRLFAPLVPAEQRVQPQNLSEALPLSNLPRPPAGFVGRQFEMVQIMERLRCTGFVNIWGASGVGKSTLALAVANYMRERLLYRNGVLRVALTESEQTVDAIFSAILRTLGPDEQIPERDLSARLEDCNMLFVFDDEELDYVPESGSESDAESWRDSEHPAGEEPESDAESQPEESAAGNALDLSQLLPPTSHSEFRRRHNAPLEGAAQFAARQPPQTAHHRDQSGWSLQASRRRNRQRPLAALAFVVGWLRRVQSVHVLVVSRNYIGELVRGESAPPRRAVPPILQRTSSFGLLGDDDDDVEDKASAANAEPVRVVAPLPGRRGRSGNSSVSLFSPTSLLRSTSISTPPPDRVRAQSVGASTRGTLERLGMAHDVDGHSVELGPLDLRVAARLLLELAGGCIHLEHFGADNKVPDSDDEGGHDRLFELLVAHPIMRELNGHPRLILVTADRLASKRMAFSDILGFLRDAVDESSEARPASVVTPEASLPRMPRIQAAPPAARVPAAAATAAAPLVAHAAASNRSPGAAFVSAPSDSSPVFAPLNDRKTKRRDRRHRDSKHYSRRKGRGKEGAARRTEQGDEEEDDSAAGDEEAADDRDAAESAKEKEKSRGRSAATIPASGSDAEDGPEAAPATASARLREEDDGHFAPFDNFTLSSSPVEAHERQQRPLDVPDYAHGSHSADEEERQRSRNSGSRSGSRNSARRQEKEKPSKSLRKRQGSKRNWLDDPHKIARLRAEEDE